MKTPFKMLILLLGSLALGISSCTLPGLQPVASTPAGDLTMTAFAKLLETHQPTATPEGQTVPTNTAQATLTEAIPVPSSTPPPSATPEPTSPLPTSTTEPDLTPSPTDSLAGPGMRSGTSITAKYLTSPPNINGDLGDWDLHIYPANQVVYGAANRTGDADLSSTVMVGWDDDYLYIGARVKDSVYVQNSSGQLLYRGDSVEIMLDTHVSTDFYQYLMSYDDYQLGVSPGTPTKNLNPEAYLWSPNHMVGTQSDVQIGVLGTANGYHIELAIPWSLYDISPYDGAHYGFAFSVSDNDSSGTIEQQSMISNVATRFFNDPTTWGDLTLEK